MTRHAAEAARGTSRGEPARDGLREAVQALADRWEHGATRRADPLPVPPEVAELREVLAAHPDPGPAVETRTEYAVQRGALTYPVMPEDQARQLAHDLTAGWYPVEVVTRTVTDWTPEATP